MVEHVFQIFYDRRAATKPIDALLLISLLSFQVLDATEDNGGKIGDLGDIERLFEGDAKDGLSYTRHRLLVCLTTQRATTERDVEDSPPLPKPQKPRDLAFSRLSAAEPGPEGASLPPNFIPAGITVPPTGPEILARAGVPSGAGGASWDVEDTAVVELCTEGW